jgi:hypothetical protein
MRKFYIAIAALAGLVQLQAQTSGTLSVSVATSSTGGQYAPRNIEAIWIEDSTGKFVKTLLAYANARKTHLNTWEASTTAAGSAFNTVDATTGATQSSHGTRTCKWDGTDRNRLPVVNGTYRLRMELTDKNGTGNIASFAFIKGPAVQNLSPANVPSFSTVTIGWVPSTSGIHSDSNDEPEVVIFPNPGSGRFNLTGTGIRAFMVTDLSGKLIVAGTSAFFDLSGQPSGIYLVTIRTEKQTVCRKIIRE